MSIQYEKEQYNRYLISVIIPAYNAEKYIKRCLESVLTQTYTNYEIVIVDDGSIDNTLAICKHFQMQNTNINILHKENGGVSSARNAGIANAKGEYIAFVDADDYIDKEYLETLVNMVNTCDAEISICGVYDVTENGTIIRKSKEFSKVITTEESIIAYLKQEYFSCVMWAKLIKKSLFQEVLFNETTNVGEDHEVFYRLLLKSSKVYVNTRQCSYFYIRHESSLTHNYDADKIYREIDITEKIANTLVQVYPNLYVVIRKWYYDWYIAMIYKALQINGERNERILKRKLRKFYEEEKEVQKQFCKKELLKIWIFSRFPFSILHLLYQIKRR